MGSFSPQAKLKGLRVGIFLPPFLLSIALAWAALATSCLCQGSPPPPLSFHSSSACPLSFREDSSGSQNLLLTTGAFATKSCYHMLTPPLLPNPKRMGGGNVEYATRLAQGAEIKKRHSLPKEYGNVW